MHNVPLTFQCIYGCSDESEDVDGKEGREWRLPGLLYADDLVLCDESEDLRVMVGQFFEMCRRRELKVNAGDGNQWRGGIGV